MRKSLRVETIDMPVTSGQIGHRTRHTVPFRIEAAASNSPRRPAQNPFNDPGDIR